MGKRITATKLAELKNSTSHCCGLDDLPDSYLGDSFATPRTDGACLCCGKTATFTWGLVHGEGHCYECGWPARFYHFVKGADGNETRIVRLLQYHPDGISLRSKAA